MEGDRKYRQRGYNDSDRPHSDNGSFQTNDRPRPQGPRPPLDITGPRLPRMVQSVTASRCYNCSTMLGEGFDFKQCPKCGVALHCCKQCSYFEPSTRFQCLKPIPARIAAKDQANECELFKARVTVARDVAHQSGPTAGAPAGTNGSNLPEPRNATDARAAFDSLFRKPE